MIRRVEILFLRIYNLVYIIKSFIIKLNREYKRGVDINDNM